MSTSLPVQKHGTLWTFAPFRNLNIVGDDVIEIGRGFSLLRPNSHLLAARIRSLMSQSEYEASEHHGRYLVFKSEIQDIEQYERDQSTERQKGMDHLHNGLMAFQIIKPSQTSGFSFHSLEFKGNLYPDAVNRRAPMEFGQWARMRSFTPEFFSQVPEMTDKILVIRRGSNAEMKNAIILLQLCLQQSHPLIAGLLATMGMEAIFDSRGRMSSRENCVIALAHPR